MTASIIASFNNNYASPGMAITVTGVNDTWADIINDYPSWTSVKNTFSSWAALLAKHQQANYITITRVEVGGTLDDEIVRGANLHNMGYSDSMVANDYEIPFGYTFYYRADLFVTGDTTTPVASLTTSNLSLPIHNDVQTYGAFLKSVNYPSLSMNALVDGADDITYPIPILSDERILGRPDPIIINDVPGMRQGEFDLLAIETPNSIGFTVKKYMDLLKSSDFLLLQSVYTDEWEDMFFRVSGDIKRVRASVQGAPPNCRAYVITVPFKEVKRPSTDGSTLLSLITWKQYKDAYSDWATLKAHATDWLSVLDGSALP